MDLINDQQHTDIRNALQDVFDTFMDTPVTFHIVTGYANDFMEGGGETTTTVTVNGLVEWAGTEGSKAAQTTDGTTQENDVTASFGFDDFDDAGLVDGNLPTLVSGRDWMEINGELYDIDLPVPSGPFQQRNVMVVVQGKRQIKTS